MKHLKRFKILIPLMVMICMLFADTDAVSAAAVTENFLSETDTIKIVSKDEQHEIIEGVYEAEITLKNTKTGSDNIKAHVLLVKPNAKASFKPVIPGYYTKVTKGTADDRKAMEWNDSDFHEAGVTQMVNEYKSAGDAKPVLAAFNGSFSNGRKAPESKVIIDGVIRHHSTKYADQFIFGHKKESGVMNIVQAGQGQDSAFDEAITGNFYFVRNGTVCNYAEADADGDGNWDHRQRHGIGIRVNGDILIITTEGGMLVEQFAQLFDASGCYNAINLDGGGSINFQTDRGDGLVRRTPSAESMGYAHDDFGDRLIPDAFMLVAEEDTVANNVGEVSGSKIVTDKDSYVQGEKIYVTASSDEEGAWVGLFPADQADVSKGSKVWYFVYGGNGDDGTAGTWCWDQGAKNDLFAEGSSNGPTSSADLLPGEYKVCVVGSDGAARDTAEFTIVEDPTLDPPTPSDELSLKLKNEGKTAYEVGEPINIVATGTASGAWVGLYNVNDKYDPDNGGVTSLRWYYTAERNGVITNIISAAYDDNGKGALGTGDYKLVLFGDGGYNNVKETIHFSIVDENSEFTINYKDGEKDITGLTPATYKYVDIKGASISLPQTAEKEGHEFKGWYDNADFSGNAVTEIAKGSVGNKTFYAKFDKLSYKVTFDTAGGSAIEAQDIVYGDKAVRPEENPTRENYNFLGWITEDGEAFDFDAPITGTTTIYAKWQQIKANEYTVTFDTAGGSAVDTQYVEDGKTAVKPADPKKNGYTFVKWVTDANVAFDFAAPITEAITLHAEWTATEYTITFDADGGKSVESKKYTIESETFELPETTKEGYVFKGWKDAEGNVYDVIEKGTYGNLDLTAKWQRLDSLTVNKTEYVVGERIKVNAYSNKDRAWVALYKDGDVIGTDLSYYWTYINCDGKDLNGVEFNLASNENKGSDAALEPGKYNVVSLYEDNNTLYNVLLSETITINENKNPVKGTIEVTGASRTDKPYTGKADYEGNCINYYYGDSITVKAETTGDAADDAWVGIVDEATFAKGDYTVVGSNWYYVGDFKDQEVNLNYVSNSVLQKKPNYASLGERWVVLVSGSGELLDAVPFFNRTFNMDWYEGYEGGATWGEAVKNKISVETEWTSKIANGEDQKPAITIKRVNGHFGYDENGKEITEELLIPGEDYTLEYPKESKEAGEYNVKISFFSSGNDKYLSTKPQYYGLADGVTYHITESISEKIITYVLNGGDNHADNPSVYTVGTEVALNVPTRVGYIFGGWYTTPDFKAGTQIEKIGKDSEEDITVYAKWTEESAAQYTIKYVLNGGEHSSIAFPTRYTGETDVSIPPAKKAGHIFVGWFYDEDFTMSADVIKKGRQGNLTLYAKFVKSNFEITTDVENGTITDGAIVKNGSSYTVAYEPESGYMLKSVTVDGEAVDISAYGSSYTFDNVSKDHHITVVFGKADIAAPTSVTAKLRRVSGGYDDVVFSWSKVKGASGYYVYYKKSTSKSYAQLTRTTGTTVTKKNLTDGAKYYFKVVPYVKVGDDRYQSDKYKTASIYTLKKVATPKVTKSGSKVRVKWTNISGESGYQISKSTKKTGTKIVSTYKTTKGTYKKITAKKGTKYYYKVRAYKLVDGKKVYGPWSSVKSYRR